MRLFKVKIAPGNSKKLDYIKHELKKAAASGIPMRPRLFLFLTVLVLTMILGAVAILLMTGTFTAGLSECASMVQTELTHANEKISQKYGLLSSEAVAFSEVLSKSMEDKLKKHGLKAAEISQHPEVLEEIISGEYERAFFAMQKSGSSGVFIILDATINPDLPIADTSRAGLYIKNMEPNIVSSSSPNITILRGFSSISRENSLALHTQWKMEFDISDAPYFSLPMEAAEENSALPLSKLYYWSPSLVLPDTSEEVMLCSVPLIDSKGDVFGVCGFEVSSMLFKLSHMPDSDTYNRIFCTLSPIKDNTIDLKKSMFAGGYSARIASGGNAMLTIQQKRRPFTSFVQDGERTFLGFYNTANLYPKSSVFADEQWAVAIMIPGEDIADSISSLNLKIFLLLIFLVIIGLTISFILSRKYLIPISKGLDLIKSSNLNEVPKTMVPEIDDLISFLSAHSDELHEKVEAGKSSLNVLDEFLENVKKLSPAERNVFNLYAQGYTAKEIADMLFLSINTIKTHNKRIYTKLNVASREELLLYVNMLKEIGKDIN